MTRIQVTKHAPDGRPPYTYEAELLEHRDGWIVVAAAWPMREVAAGPVTFMPGDRLIEFFSTDDYFNAFLIRRPDGAFAGWYCNVTHPTVVADDKIHWHDLYLDVIVDQQGAIHIEDEDELDASGLADSDPALFRTILATRDRLIDLIERHAYPFCYEG